MKSCQDGSAGGHKWRAPTGGSGVKRKTENDTHAREEHGANLFTKKL